MLSRLYKKYIKDKYFNKLLFTYTAILIFAFILLTSLILRDITSSSRSNAAQYNASMVQNISSYFKLKVEKVKTIVQQLYLNHGAFSDVLELLEQADLTLSDKYLSMTKSLDSYMKSAISMDDDIASITIIKLSDEETFTLGADKNFNLIDIPAVKGFLSDSLQLTQSIQEIMPSSLIFEKGSQNGFSILTCLRSKDFSKITGILIISFSDSSIRKAYSDVGRKFESDITVVTKDGAIISDSSGRPAGEFYKSYDADTGSFDPVLSKNHIIGVNVLSESGIHIISMTSNSQVFESTRQSRNAVFLIFTISILLSIFLLYMSITFFSKRIKALQSAMNKVKTGDLSTRVKIEKNNDEISQITSNFNQMCDELNNYIDKVYIAELNQKDAALKQRSAELYALQSQVNPHFLYNTLEAIRMRAVTTGNEDVSTMIRILATLFRSSIKKDMVIKIRDELDYSKSYLELYNIRYADSLEVLFEIDEDILDYGIIKLLLQPLIENAIVHGINVNEKNNIITIKGFKAGNNISFSITDNGNGIDEDTLRFIKKSMVTPVLGESENIGIVNVSQRIKLFFGNDYGVRIDSKKGLGTTITIKIPAKTIEELEKNVQSSAGG